MRSTTVGEERCRRTPRPLVLALIIATAVALMFGVAAAAAQVASVESRPLQVIAVSEAVLAEQSELIVANSMLGSIVDAAR